MNTEEAKYYAANLLYQCRCDWSDSRQVRFWIEMAKDLLPADFAELLDEEYIQNAQYDGRNCRDGLGSYNSLLPMIDKNAISPDFIQFMEKEFDGWILSLE